MEQKESKQYWEIFETKVRPLSERQQRIIAYKFCLLVEKDLDNLGKGVLKLVEQLTSDHVSLQDCTSYREQLQNKLPDEGTSPYSPLIWALTPHTDTYPAWYSAAIAGLNIVDLKISTLPELTDLTKGILNDFYGMI
ncbi:hypothetical protein [Chitinophaga ginsengisoli]|uniref:Uncharacterized protein n=1 Tax=Chitinophaga ginsengisoli TaxID=363837 RepID=A0A2P8GN62_9BACT|nr:hypothetical protein [Chitinophaga ginsengisoli]PSL35385.1 hypothetical protein CLV42_101142 [Chitinophaga ginsengisoli]